MTGAGVVVVVVVGVPAITANDVAPELQWNSWPHPTENTPTSTR